MAYFDTHKDTYITVDASPVWLSAILSQRSPGNEDDKVVCYASRALTKVEQRYSQTKKGGPCNFMGEVEHFHMFIYGK